MKESDNNHLASIRTGIWSIFGALLMILGYQHTRIAESELGELIVILGLIAGILIILFVIFSVVYRILMKLKKIAEEENKR